MKEIWTNCYFFLTQNFVSFQFYFIRFDWYEFQTYNFIIGEMKMTDLKKSSISNWIVTIYHYYFYYL